MEPKPKPFRDVSVLFGVLGNTRVEWTMNSHFRESQPWTFQLQVGETSIPSYNPDGTARTDDWADVGLPTTELFALDPTRRAYGSVLNVFYRIKLTTGPGNIYYSEPAGVYGQLSETEKNIAREIVRKEQLRNSTKTSVQGYLLKRKRSGTKCPACIDPNTDEITNSDCPTCFDTRWVGGYYDPVPTVFSDVTNIAYNETLDESEGTVDKIIIKGRFVSAPQVQARDVWVEKFSDLRFFVNKVEIIAQLRGVPLIVDATLTQLDFDDIMYTFQVDKTT